MTAKMKDLGTLTDWLIKFAIILFILPVFYDAFQNMDIGSSFFNTLIKILIVVIFITLSIILCVLGKRNYRIFGFFGVLIVSFYKFLEVFFSSGIQAELVAYILLMAISIHFLTRSNRVRR